jgi:hypothetical protein
VRVRLESTVVRAGSNRIVVTVSDPQNRELANPDSVLPDLSGVGALVPSLWIVGARGTARPTGQ